MNTIRYIDKGETIAKKVTVDVDRQLVGVTCTTKNHKRDAVCAWTFDFSDCTPAEILTLATRSVVIMQQIVVRAANSLTPDDVNGTIDVHEMLAPRKRETAAPAVVIARNVDKLTPEQRVELLAQLTAMAKATRST